MIEQGAMTLAEPIVARAKDSAEQTCLIFIQEDGSETTLSVGEFHRASTGYAQALEGIGLEANDIAILVMRHSLELIFSFWGAMYLGATPAIFPFLTEKLDRGRYLDQVRQLVAHSGATVVITYPELRDTLTAVLGDLECEVLCSEDVPAASPSSGWQLRRQHGNDIALLQHSSGTTGLQKGVALSHEAVLNQLRAYSSAIALRPQDVVVSWLPLYHDMGLIAGFVLPLVAGIPLVLLSPFHWVRSPRHLLWAVHNHRGTLSWLPNFAHNHCVRAISGRDLEGLDLSSWRAVINCSEPVRHDSHHQFWERFTPFGLPQSAVATCYAMAENTFAVTQSRIGAEPTVDWVDLVQLQQRALARPVPAYTSGATPVVSCGTTIAGTAIKVVDTHGQEVPERAVGEIVIQGNSMLQGYHRRPELSAQALKNGWFHTGDMGYLAAGELYVVGRSKDLIIVGGKNLYPQDLEAIANKVPGIHPGRAVAFGIDNERLGSESVVLVCETDVPAAGQDAIVAALRQRLVREADVTAGDIRLVTRGWLIKTSSGKLARAANREKYLAAFRP